NKGKLKDPELSPVEPQSPSPNTKSTPHYPPPRTKSSKMFIPKMFTDGELIYLSVKNMYRRGYSTIFTVTMVQSVPTNIVIRLHQPSMLYIFRNKEKLKDPVQSPVEPRSPPRHTTIIAHQPPPRTKNSKMFFSKIFPDGKLIYLSVKNLYRRGYSTIFTVTTVQSVPRNIVIRLYQRYMPYIFRTKKS
ncbi:hypothetical protein WA026_000176, partial [Henosepilachna vigintioctopunctata]